LRFGFVVGGLGSGFRRGFTAVELLIALALAAVVSLGALGLLGTIYASDSAAQKRFDGEAELQTLQRAVRSLARNLTAKRAPDPTSGFGPEPKEADIKLAEDQLKVELERSGQPFTPESLRSQAIETARKNAREAAASKGDEREHIPPRFEIRFDSTGSGGAVPVLEALLTDAPVPPAWSPDPETQRWAMSANLVRGVIEGVRTDDFKEKGWTLQWRQTEPAAEPVTLARGIAGWEWSALPRKAHDKDKVGFVETAAAWYGSDYPRAVRLRVMTLRGAQADWLFEVPRPIPEIADADDTQEESLTEEENGTASDALKVNPSGSGFLPSPTETPGGRPVKRTTKDDFKSRINQPGGK
jgi:prepilin-type N-terminal cleavage/methylation domain-containing protein